MQLYKDFRQQQQKQRAEDDKRLREKLFREAEKTQFKMNIIKGNEEEVTIETEQGTQFSGQQLALGNQRSRFESGCYLCAEMTSLQ